MLWVEEKYLSLVSSQLPLFKKVRQGLYQFRCPYCHDSQKNKKKARGYLYLKNNSLFYRCHNCGQGRTFSGFLKDLSPDNFKSFYMEKFKENNRSSLFFKEETDEKIEDEIEEIVEEKEDTEYLGAPILSLPSTHECIKYLNQRKIPKARWADLFYVDSLAKLQQTFPTDYDFENLPKDKRIVFPIRNRRGELVGISARAITKTQLRYVILRKKPETMIFNLDKIDIGKPVLALEGAIDSMFLPNSIAVDGSDFMKLAEIVPKDNLIIVVDNENRNKEIVAKMEKICEAGFKMVIWPDWIKKHGKDVNEMIINGLSIEKIIETINENTYSGLKCKLALAKWRN